MSNNSFKVKHSVVLTPKNLSTLVNPESGELACDINDGNKIKRYNSDSGSWVEVGSGGGGINYIVNDDFESDANGALPNGWARYADTPAVEPVDGTGGSPNAAFTFLATTTTPLRGTKSALITKDANNRQGHGVSEAFTIDPADQAQILRISFDYSTSANYADGDIRIYVYDVTNSRLIEVIDRDLFASAQGKFTGTFQSSPDSTSYRLIFHVADSFNLAWTVEIDNVNVSPQTIVKGAIVTDWENFVPTISGITGYSAIGKYRRVGDSAELTYLVTKDAVNGTGTGGVFFDLPSGLALDQEKLNLNNSNNVNGVANYRLGGTGNNTIASVNVRADTGISIRESNASTVLVGTDITANTQISIILTVPILGWSSNVTLSEDAGNREIALKVSESLSQSLTDNLQTKVGFTGSIIIDYDTTASWDKTLHRYIVPESGFYTINGAVVYGSTGSTERNVGAFIYVNGTSIGGNFKRALSANSVVVESTRMQYLVKGQYVELFAYQNDVSGSTAFNVTQAAISIIKNSSPQTIAASEVVAASYISNSGQSIGTGLTTVIFEDKVFDTHNAYNTSTGKYTVPQSGVYSISTFLAAVYTSTAVSNRVQLVLKINDVATLVKFTRAGYVASSTWVCDITSTAIKLNKGDVIELTADLSVAGNMGASNNLFSISKINGVN